MNRRARTGLAGVAVLAGLCCVGPELRSEPPRDPLHAALLAPLTRVTVLTLDDGSQLVAPDVAEQADRVAVTGSGRSTTVAAARISHRDRYRFWLGSDRFGRDVLQQLMEGGRISLGIAAFSLLLALAVGGTVGMAAATGGPIVDSLLMRLVDGLLAFPVLFLMILVASVFRPDPVALVVLLGLTSWMGVARLVRGQVLSLRNRPFILAAVTSGSPWHRIAIRHYAPNISGPVAQDAALRMGDLVLAEATLSFLGLGVPPAVPTWGSLVADGQRVMPDGWWLVVFPGLAIAALVIGLALIGDGLQRSP
jgi:peptide/nickel transport system permease protein